jgi:large subunit ribosomal protein L28
MSRKCEITGKTGLNGHRVSHANNKTNHVQQPNLRKIRVYVAELRRFMTVKLSSKGLRILDRKGPYRALKDAGLI